MKRLTIALVSIICVSQLYAQSLNAPDILKEPVPQIEAAIDSSYFGVDIFELVEQSSEDDGFVKINQTSDIASGMTRYIAANKVKKISGWRVRIYFDNSQNARTQSETIAYGFMEEYPSIKAYRSHVSPYFKVTVGDFRTKYDAQQFANKIKSKYPSVFLVRENINYPLF